MKHDQVGLFERNHSMSPDVQAGRLREDHVRTFEPKLSIVVPTYNEAKNLPHVFALLPEGLHEVIVVDGRSVDGTVDVARKLRPDVRIVQQNRRGKGNAL